MNALWQDEFADRMKRYQAAPLPAKNNLSKIRVSQDWAHESRGRQLPPLTALTGIFSKRQ